MGSKIKIKAGVATDRAYAKPSYIDAIRCVKLVLSLINNGDTTVRKLAVRLKCSERTILRYTNVLPCVRRVNGVVSFHE